MDFRLDDALPVLERTPHTLRAMLGGLSPAWTDATEGGDSWSPYGVVGHLIHADRTNWIPRAETILAQGADRRFPAFDRTGQVRASEGKSLAQLLDEFVTVRAESLATVRAWHLTEAQLGLEGIHPQFGPVTLRQVLATWVGHDLTHTSQIVRVMAKQYRGAVGPFAEFLSVMR